MKRSLVVHIPMRVSSGRERLSSDESYQLDQWTDSVRRALEGDASGWISIALIAAEGWAPLFARPNAKLARRILEELVDDGNTDAMFSLAELLDPRARSPSEREMVRALRLRAWKQGRNVFAAHNIACDARSSNDLASAMRWFRKAYLAGEIGSALQIVKLILGRRTVTRAARMEAHDLLETVVASPYDALSPAEREEAEALLRSLGDNEIPTRSVRPLGPTKTRGGTPRASARTSRSRP